MGGGSGFVEDTLMFPSEVQFHCRMQGQSPQIQLLSRIIMCRNDVYDRPAHTFKCDETGMPLNPKCPKVVSELGAKKVRYSIPPFVIFDRKTLNPKSLTLCFSRETLMIVDNSGMSGAQRARASDIIQAVQHCVDGHIHESMERRNFRYCTQQPREAFDDFLVAL